MFKLAKHVFKIMFRVFKYKTLFLLNPIIYYEYFFLSGHLSIFDDISMTCAAGPNANINQDNRAQL